MKKTFFLLIALFPILALAQILPGYNPFLEHGVNEQLFRSDTSSLSAPLNLSDYYYSLGYNEVQYNANNSTKYDGWRVYSTDENTNDPENWQLGYYNTPFYAHCMYYNIGLAPAVYLWEIAWGDGTSTNERNMNFSKSHSYSAAGQYEQELTVYNLSGDVEGVYYNTVTIVDELFDIDHWENNYSSLHFLDRGFSNNVLVIEGWDPVYKYNPGYAFDNFDLNEIEGNIWYLNFTNPKADLRILSMATAKAIKFIDNFQEEPFIVIGTSMGGVLGRFALAWLEDVSLGHNVDKLLTIDSPHRGALLNKNLQMDLKHIYDMIDDLPEDVASNLLNTMGMPFQNIVKEKVMLSSLSDKRNAYNTFIGSISPSALQMVRNNIWGIHSNSINDNGGLYPSTYGTKESLYFYSYLNPSDRILYNQLYGNDLPPLLNSDKEKPGYPNNNNITCALLSLGSTSEIDISGVYSDLEIEFEGRGVLMGNTWATEMITETDVDMGYYPGSYFSWEVSPYTSDWLGQQGIAHVKYTIDHIIGHKSCFMPTYSSLDIEDSNNEFIYTPHQVITQSMTNRSRGSYILFDNSIQSHGNIQYYNDVVSMFVENKWKVNFEGQALSNLGLLDNVVVKLKDFNENILSETVTDINGVYSINDMILDLGQKLKIEFSRSDIPTRTYLVSLGDIDLGNNSTIEICSYMQLSDQTILFVNRDSNDPSLFHSVDDALEYLNEYYELNPTTEAINSYIIVQHDIEEENIFFTWAHSNPLNVTIDGRGRSHKKLYMAFVNGTYTLRNFNFDQNESELELALGGEVNLTIKNSSFNDINNVPISITVECFSPTVNQVDVSIDNCVFENNNSGIKIDNFIENNLISITNCSFTNNSNTATYYDDYDLAYLNTDSIIGVGGAIYINGGNTLENAVTIDNCTFSDNHAKVGGAIFVKGIPELTIENSTFIDNYIDSENIVYNGIYKASSIYIHKTNLNLNHNIFDEFVDNSTFMSPDALLSLSGNSELYSLNNTYINNYSGRSILCYDNSQISCINDIFQTTENQANAIACFNGTQGELTNCIVHGYGSSNPVPVSSGYVVADPLLDSDYRPIWTLTQQSPCIEAGVRDLDGDGAWWFEDKDDQDVFGTRPEIGAIPADMDGWGHVLPADQVRWICFPYTLNDPSRYELTHYLEGAQVNLIHHEYTNQVGSQANTPVFGQKGFKIKSVDDIKIDHFGKPVGHPLHYHPSGNQIILSRLPFAESGSNLIGYYKEESCNPMDAFQELLDSGMIESVKAEDWTIYYGYPQSPKGSTNDLGWHLISHTGKKPSLDLGEAVEVVYCGENEQIEFNWSNGIPSVPKVKSTKPTTFAYEEKENYLPMQVNISEFAADKSEEFFGELGVYINGECKGAGIISDSLVTVFAYLDSLVLSENDTLSFVVHDYKDSKSVKKIDNYRVYDSNSDSYVTKLNHKITDTVVFFDLTSKDDQENNALPIATEIKSIYPNPFNPETTIEFNLKENSDVNIRVYNLKGQLVKTVINSKFEAGNHKVVWNGTNSNEQRVASGLYFCRMETKNKSVTKKMILMK